MTRYYDYVLGLIPVALVGVSGLLTLAGAPTTMAVPVGASIAMALMCHAMFVRNPTAEGYAASSDASQTPRFGSAD